MSVNRCVIDLGALEHNFRVARELAGPDRRIFCVVKADAYGHGMVEAAGAFARAGAGAFCVFRVGEGVLLRRAGFDQPVLALAQPMAEEAELAVLHGITTTIYDEGPARDLAAVGQKVGRPARAHVKVDSGMGRLGVNPEGLPGFLRKTDSLEGLHITGLFSHFAVADVPGDPYTDEQAARFDEAARSCPDSGLLLHTANSAALMRGLVSDTGAARPGIMLYGSPPHPDIPGADRLLPSMSLTTRICMVKDLPAGRSVSYGRTFTTNMPSRIASIPLGYENGYPRILSNRAEALVRGRRVPQVGTICMNLCMLDVTDVPGVETGDEVVLLGRQGDERITAENLAARAGTISYEIFCGIGKANPRYYLR
ncbi:MAG: alanine racemase [Desulfatibacillaceae bacterium]